MKLTKTTKGSSGKEHDFSIMPAFYVMSIFMQKIKVRCQSVKEILRVKEDSNLIVQKHFQPCSSVFPQN